MPCRDGAEPCAVWNVVERIKLHCEALEGRLERVSDVIAKRVELTMLEPEQSWEHVEMTLNRDVNGERNSARATVTRRHHGHYIRAILVRFPSRKGHV